MTESDIPAYERHFIDYEVIRHLSAVVPWPYPPDGVRHHVMNNVVPKQGDNKWVWGLRLHQDPDELIGVVDLWRPGKPEHRGFWLGRRFWGNGYMTEAVLPITDFAFEALGFETIVFSNAVGNTRSRRIKEKTGASLVGVEAASFVDPIYQQHEIWALSREAWQTHRHAMHPQEP